MCGAGAALSEEEVETQEKLRGGLWYARTVFSMCLLALTILLGMTGTIKIGLENIDLIAEKDAGTYTQCFNVHNILNLLSPSSDSSSCF